jgi:sporulation protein YlmC with PRC-barrel domain
MDLNLFPVPANDHLNVTFNSVSEEQTSVQLLNMLGKQVYTYTSKSNGGLNEIQIDLNGITPGIYFIEVINGSQKSIEKVVVE